MQLAASSNNILKATTYCRVGNVDNSTNIVQVDKQENNNRTKKSTRKTMIAIEILVKK